MAYQLIYWKYSKGPEFPDDLDEVMPARRIKKVIDIPNVLRPIPKECDVVTLSRTDKQSFISRIIWSKKYN